MEWKKKQRKRRTHLIVMAVAVAASLTVFLSLGFAWGGWIGSTIVATIGAVILLFLLGLIKRRA